MSSSRPARVLVASALAASLFVGACSGGGGEPEPAESTSAASATDTADPAGSGDVEIPDTPVGVQAGWALEQLAAADGPDPESAAERFDAAFLDQAPAEQMAAVFDQLRSAGPYTPTAYEGSDTQAVVSLTGAGTDGWALNVSVGDDGLITGLFLQPAMEVPEISDWAGVDAALAATGATSSVYAADVVDGTCETVYESGAQGPRPLGSVVKLYVLGAVQQAVLDGDLAWDDTVTVTDELRSLPTGELQDLPAGTDVTVGEAATKMISISDNTATDLLIDLVGRDAVEEQVPAMGNTDPARLMPVVSTRELFHLGWTDPALRAAWSEADEAGRRAILDGVPSGPPPVDPATMAEPVFDDGIGWFATGADVCAAHAALQDLAAADESGTVRDLLAVNPGTEFDSGTWPYVAYKGGSIPGVVALSWYVEDQSGAGRVLVVQLTAEDPAALADVAYLVGTATEAFDLLAG